MSVYIEKYTLRHKIIRTSTVGESLNILLRGQLSFLCRDYDILGVASGKEDLDKVTEREGIPTVDLRMERRINVFRDLCSLVRLYFLFKREKPTIVHSITPKAGLLSMCAAKAAGVPLRFHTFTGLIFPYKSGLYKAILIVMDKLLCAAATSVYPEGNGVRNDLKSYGITSKPLKILHNGNVNGVDFDLYNPQRVSEQTTSEIQKIYALQNTTVFLFIGRLVTDKGIAELVKSFELLYETRHDISLLLVGKEEAKLDPLPKDILEIIKSHPSIHAVGYQEDVRPYIAVSDILVFPSYREGFPNVPLQCAAFSKALILSDISGCNEIVKHGETGVLVKPKSVDELWSAMKLLAEDKKKRAVYGEKVFAFVQENFKQEEVWQAIVNEYEEQLLYLAKAKVKTLSR